MRDVYCERPETLTIREERIIVDTARRYGRVFSKGGLTDWDAHHIGGAMFAA